jgi:hypothetical protein
MVKKFIFETTREAKEPQRFEGYLESRQCIATSHTGRRCTKRCIIGIPYCWIHLQYQHNLKIKKSTIPNGGLGLFAFNKQYAKDDNKVIFKPNQKIVQYIGEIVNSDTLQERYGDYTAPYAIQVKKNTYIDGALVRGVANLANHRPRASTQNARLGNPNQKGELYVVATKPIYHNQEIFVNYGREYEFDDFTTHKTIYVAK